MTVTPFFATQGFSVQDAEYVSYICQLGKPQKTVRGVRGMRDLKFTSLQIELDLLFTYSMEQSPS